MRKPVTFLLVSALLIAMAGPATAHPFPGRGRKAYAKGWKQLKVKRDLSDRWWEAGRGLWAHQLRDVDNYGRRRAALAHHQNAERRALHNRQMEQRRLARSAFFGRLLAERHREQLGRQQPSPFSQPQHRLTDEVVPYHLVHRRIGIEPAPHGEILLHT